MPRANRNYPSVYFGRPGALVTLPWPRGEIDKPYDRPVFEFETGGGEYLASSLPTGSREFSLAWNALHVDNYALLEQFWTGMNGQGPWVFIDPTQTNMMRQNQASATNLFRDNRQFVASAGVLQSNNVPAYVHRLGATRSLRWSFSSTPGGTPTLTLTYPYRSWYGFPAVPGLPYTLSCWMRPDGSVDTDITVAVKLTWIDAAGAQIGAQLSGGDLSTVGWQRRSIGGVAPPGTAYVSPSWVITGSSVTAGGSLFLDEPMLEQDDVLNTWAPGTGLRAVEITSLTDSAPFDGRFRRGVVMTLRELAA